MWDDVIFAHLYSTAKDRHQLTLYDFDHGCDGGRRGVCGRGLHLAAPSLALVLSLEVIVVAPTPAVHELCTLLLVCVVVPLQLVRVARAGLARLAAHVWNNGTIYTIILLMSVCQCSQSAGRNSCSIVSVDVSN